ncbi:uncharacterized protein METZ01_LOCUS297761 [marine metagenome]|uniref:Uncharacterized protein n=1 Tax=marine metagenome TaxID=408172 RepID=A0A382MB25_9ZZZZ
MPKAQEFIWDIDILNLLKKNLVSYNRLISKGLFY